MLIACVIVGETVLWFNDHAVTPDSAQDRGDDPEKYWAYLLSGNLAALWIMMVASVAIGIELTCTPLHIITSIFCGSNFSIFFEILVRVMCVCVYSFILTLGHIPIHST